MADHMPRSRWRPLRRRWAPLAALIVLALVLLRSVDGRPVSVEIEVVFGRYAALAQSLDVEYYRDGDPEPVAHMHQQYGRAGAAGSAHQRLALAPGRYRAVVVVTTAGAPIERHRRFVVDHAATVRISVVQLP